MLKQYDGHERHDIVHVFGIKKVVLCAVTVKMLPNMQFSLKSLKAFL
jgi:hypothetical protein